MITIMIMFRTTINLKKTFTNKFIIKIKRKKQKYLLLSSSKTMKFDFFYCRVEKQFQLSLLQQQIYFQQQILLSFSTLQKVNFRIENFL